MKQLIMISILLVPFIAAGCEVDDSDITSFQECVDAGNPVMESYPRQCKAGDDTFKEELKARMEFTICREKPEICTFEYDPVCSIIDNGVRCVTTPCPSTDAKDFGNACQACSVGARGYYSGECSKKIFVVCKETATGFDPEDYADETEGGVCVDICPGNYDPFTTQTGIELCIKHYGKEEISSWPVCDRSTDGCDCVKAYETTEEEPIDDPAYRCVPEMYAQRLLFRAGTDRLDKEGKGSVVIA